jgi:aarF domain-containing kinase
MLLIVGLTAGLGMGAASEMIRHSTGNSKNESGSLLLSASDVSRLVDKLSKMRGAALKLGQFMSIQGQQLIVPVRFLV